MRKVLNVEPYGYSRHAMSLWKEKGYDYVEASWDEVALGNKWDEVEILIVRLSRIIDFKELSYFSNLKIIVSATTGLDHLNIEALAEKGVEIISLKGEKEFLDGIPSTAEHAWALIQNIMRNIPSASSDVRAGNWNRDRFRGYQLKNKTIGIIGLGRTGGKVAKYAEAFDMKVMYYDPFVDSNAYAKMESLNNLLASADVITLHVHLNEQTQYLLNGVNIEKVKQGSYLVNTSRAAIWDEESVVQALAKGQIGGVATDVLITELSEIKDSPLWKASQTESNIIITPHIGGATWDAMWACEEYIIKQIQ
jgi:D-3-phosphoglycerate dehydrogenase